MSGPRWTGSATSSPAPRWGAARRCWPRPVGAQKLSDPAKAAAFEARVLGNAEDKTLQEIRRSVTVQLLTLDPEGAEERRQRSRRDRRVTRRALEDGAGHLGVTGPAEAIAV